MWWIIVILILTGIVLMLIEMLLTPGVGVAGILSLGALTGACWYSFVYIGPETGRWVTVGSVLLLSVMLYFILRAKTWRRFELQTEVKSKVNTEVCKLRPGDRGIAQTRLAPVGTGRFPQTSCEVKSADNSMIAAGTQIEIVCIEDNKPLVKHIID